MVWWRVETMSSKGIALVSVIVAAAILGIAISLAATSLISGARVARQAANITAASNFAEGILERVRSQPYGSISSREITDELPDLPSARCEVKVTPRGAGLKEVTVTCSWQEAQRPRSVKLATLVASRGVR
jgi:type II secretory pathway pseudopilin PulG